MMELTLECSGDFDGVCEEREDVPKSMYEVLNGTR